MKAPLAATSAAFPWRRLACAFLAGIASASAAVVPGAEPKDWPPNPAQHPLAICREAADAAQAALIAAAEAALPSPDQWPAAVPPIPRPTDPQVWWYKEELGLRIPFALTGQALAYYTEIAAKYAQQSFKRYSQPSSHLDYRATLKAHPQFSIDGHTYQNVKVVTLKLTFSETFAATATEGLQFTKQRLVVFDPAGKILHISGDGPTEVPILAM